MSEALVQVIVVTLTASCLIFILSLAVWQFFGEVARFIRYIKQKRRK